MPHTVFGLYSIDLPIIKKLNNIEREFLLKKFQKEVIERSDWLKILKAVTSDGTIHVDKALSQSEHIYEFNYSETFLHEYKDISDWIIYVRKQKNTIYKKIYKMNWQQLLHHARIHKSQPSTHQKRIPIDFDENCPIVLDMDKFKWVWLRTKKSRLDESISMRNCLNNIDIDTNYFFSLRDNDGVPHIDVELSGNMISQIGARRNGKVEKKYAFYIDELHKIVGLRLLLKRIPTSFIEDGATIFDGISYIVNHEKLDSTSNPAKVDFEYEYWYRDGNLSRNDGPAVVCKNFWFYYYLSKLINYRRTKKHIFGKLEWYLDGRLHREDGPAILWSDGSEEWYLHGKRHREDGPAVKGRSVIEGWYVNGLLHREDGPAILNDNGDKYWYSHGLLNRVNGPSIEKYDGTKIWFLNGLAHRTDGPALITDKKLEWYLDGRLHREDGPAILWSDGSEEWYLHGKRHREDGPAVKDTTLTMEWWKDGILQKKSHYD